MIDRKRLYRTAVVATALIFAASLAAQAADTAETATSDFKVAATAPGSVLSVETKPPAESLAHVNQQYLMTYRSCGVDGEPIVASGYALIPEGEPPEGGWPVLAWAHGTTGVADICAPSAIYPGGPESGYHQLVLPVLPVLPVLVDWWTGGLVDWWTGG
ncbi:MAG: hypothetical protein L0H83_00920 [Salinisphaera sp.]|nr:hypothetical protein [Salinisphaera sp.]